MAVIYHLGRGHCMQQVMNARGLSAGRILPFRSAPTVLHRCPVAPSKGFALTASFSTVKSQVRFIGTPLYSLQRTTLCSIYQRRHISGPEKAGKRKTLPTKLPKAASKVISAIKKNTPHENIYTVPNILTFSRLIAAPVVGWLVLHDYHAWAFGLFAYAGITDLVDGYIARRWKLQTVVGTVIDPMADKTLMTILTVCLAVKGTLPVWLAIIILGRDVALALTAIYIRYISLPPPKTFARYWDFSLPSAEVHPTTISKYNTALQLALIGTTTALPLITKDLGVAITGLQYLVATTTVWSGMSYIWSKDAVKILNHDEHKSRSETVTGDNPDKSE